MKKIITAIDRKIRRVLLKHTIHGPELTKEAIKRLVGKKNPVIFEIGCADGLDTLEFLKTFPDPGLKMYCFEPDPRNIEAFKKRINDPRVELIPMAIGDTEGVMAFHQSSTIYSSSLKDPDLSTIQAQWPDISFKNDIEIKVTTIDAFTKKHGIETIDFIWADVQGAEDLMLTGAKESLKNRIKYIYTEYATIEYYKDSPNLKKILETLGSNWKIVRNYKTDVLLKNKNTHHDSIR